MILHAMKLLKKIRHSLSIRLLLLFTATGIVISLLFQAMLGAAIGQHVKEQIFPHLRQYVDYIYHDIGSPPDIHKAEQLAQNLPIAIHIQSDSGVWQSSPIPDWIQHEKLKHRYTSRSGQDIAYDFEREGVILRYQQAGNKVLIWAKGWQRPNHKRGRLLFGLAILIATLGALYYFIRRLFRPIQTIQQGVKIIGTGKLSHRIEPARNDELGELADSINHMADDIEQMLESKRELLLAISHELRSPLTRAKVSVALLEESSAQANIERDLREMENMIAELLEAERLNGRHQTLNKTAANLNDITRSVINEHFPDAVFTVKLDSELPQQSLDMTRLKLVVRNLLDNAQKHQKDGAEAISVTTTYTAGNTVLTIQDHGHGIAPEHLVHLTEPFYRTDASRQRKTGGFGLGLYLVKLIVEAHRGELKIDSEVGIGTTVRVVLPVATSDE